jgi:hypothetical protein
LHWLGWLQYFAHYSQRILQWWPHFVMVEEGVHMAPQRLRWAPQNLHWYTTVVTWRRRNSSKWWHIILLSTSFLGRRRSFSYNPSLYFSSTAQEVLPLTKHLSPQEKVLTLPSERGKFTLATLKPPLSSRLIYLSFFIYSNHREVLGRRWFGFLVIPGLKEIANMER